MSDSDNHDGPHEGPIKTPKQLVLAVVFSFVIPIFLIILLVKYVTTEHGDAAGSEGLSAEAVARRIQPIGSIEVKDASDTAALKTGARSVSPRSMEKSSNPCRSRFMRATEEVVRFFSCP